MPSFTRRPSTISSVICLSLLALTPFALLGCGGGGTPNSPSGLTALGEATIGVEISGLTPDASYYPLGTGDTRVWLDHFDGETETFAEDVREPTAFEGKESVRVVTSGSSFYMKVDSVGVYDFGDIDENGGVFVTAPPDVLHWSLAVGATETLSTVESKKTSTGTAFESRTVSTVTRKPDRRIVLASGTFDCVVYELQQQHFESELPGATPTDTVESAIYLSSGVGIVYTRTRSGFDISYAALKYASVGGKTFGSRSRVEPKSNANAASGVGKSFLRH